MDSPTIELMSALASMYESGKYSDLTIACGSKRYPVHRALLASRSTFFDGICRNNFRESETGVVDLSEDDPEAVEHMVHYFYHLDYLSKQLSRRSSQQGSRPMLPRSQRNFASRSTKKFNLNLVEDPLIAMASAVNASMPLTPPEEQSNQFDERYASAKLPNTPMADQCTEDPFDSLPVESERDIEKSHLVTHAKVYAIAEKYGISGLKSLAQKKFAQQLEAHISSEEFSEACQEAYESTVDSDRGLRDVIIQAFRSHPSLSLRKDVEMTVRDTPGLAFELFRMASGLPVFS